MNTTELYAHLLQEGWVEGYIEPEHLDATNPPKWVAHKLSPRHTDNNRDEQCSAQFEYDKDGVSLSLWYNNFMPNSPLSDSASFTDVVLGAEMDAVREAEEHLAL